VLVVLAGPMERLKVMRPWRELDQSHSSIWSVMMVMLVIKRQASITKPNRTPATAVSHTALGPTSVNHYGLPDNIRGY